MENAMRPKNLLRPVPLLLVVLALSVSSFAKRVAPPKVTPITVGDITYSAPTENMGYVEARNAKTGDLLWARQIYVVVKHPDLEEDVQDVFISKLERNGDTLVITNEVGSEFNLDLASLEVKTIKGSVRVEQKEEKLLR